MGSGADGSSIPGDFTRWGKQRVLPRRQAVVVDARTGVAGVSEGVDKMFWVARSAECRRWVSRNRVVVV